VPTEALLEIDGRRLAQALGALAVGLILLLFAAIFVPLIALVSVLPDPAANAPKVIERSPRQDPAPEPDWGRLHPPTGSAPVDLARHYLGVPYVFGGSDPAIGLDCSGLVQLVFRQLGLSLPRTAQLQYSATARIPRNQLEPGDLVFFAQTYQDASDWITHVGIYIGNGQQINAPTEGQRVSIQPVFTGFWGAHFVGGGRIGSGSPYAHWNSLFEV
jgi:cell wall-associated NlpC family hydrolase